MRRARRTAARLARWSRGRAAAARYARPGPNRRRPARRAGRRRAGGLRPGAARPRAGSAPVSESPVGVSAFGPGRALRARRAPGSGRVPWSGPDLSGGTPASPRGLAPPQLAGRGEGPGGPPPARRPGGGLRSGDRVCLIGAARVPGPGPALPPGRPARAAPDPPPGEGAMAMSGAAQPSSGAFTINRRPRRSMRPPRVGRGPSRLADALGEAV